MEPFATATQMESRSRGAIPATHPFLPNALAAATRKIREYCRWHIATAEDLTLKRRGPFRQDVWIPAMEIAEITAVTIDGTVWAQPDLDALADQFDPATGWTGLSGRAVEVSYTAGFATVPEDIIDLTLMIASRSLGSPLGATREQTLVSSVTWSQAGFNIAGGTVLLEHEKADLDGTYRIGRLP